VRETPVVSGRQRLDEAVDVEDGHGQLAMSEQPATVDARDRRVE
jgi:hypothetical protein